MSVASSIRDGNQNWLGQYGATRTISASSCRILVRQNGIRLNGGKQNPDRPFQLNEKASVFQAPGWGKRLTKAGNCAFQELAKRSSSVFQID